MAQSLEELEQRSRRGDHRAACRLGEELRRCHEQAWRIGVAPTTDQQIIERLSGMRLSDDRLERELQRQLARRDRQIAVAAHCAGIDPSVSRRAPYFQLQAAQAGHVAAMLAIANPSSAHLGADLVADPGLARLYHEHALTMFLRLLEAGHPDAATLLAMSQLPGSISPLGSLLPEEWRDVNVAAGLMHRIGALTVERARQAGHVGPEVSDLGPGPSLDAEQARRVDALFERHFVNSPHVQELLQQIDADPAPDAASYPDARERCDRAG